MTDSPFRWVLFRTGPASYVSASTNQFATAVDGQARVGLPWVSRRNLLVSTSNIGASTWSDFSGSASVASNQVAPDGSIAQKLTLAQGAQWGQAFSDAPVGSSVTIYFEACATANTSVIIAGYDATNGQQQTAETITTTWQKFAFTLSYGSTTAMRMFWQGPTGGTAIFVRSPQVQVGSLIATQVVYQPIDANGNVDLSNPLNGAGLVLEQASTNLLSSNQATCTDTLGNTTGFQATDPTGGGFLAAGATVASDSGTSWQGSKRLAVTTTAVADEGVATTYSAVVSPGAQIAVSGMLLAPAGSSMRFSGCDNYGNRTSAVYTGTGAWQPVSTVFTSNASGSPQVSVQCRNEAATAITFYLDALKVEQASFVTSWCDGTRTADQVALWIPQQYASVSRDFSTWAPSGNPAYPGWSAPANSGLVVASDGQYRAQVWTIAHTTDYLTGPVIATDVPLSSVSWTAAVRMKAGTLSASVLLQWVDQNGAVVGSAVTCPLTSTIQTYPVTCSPTSATTSLQLRIAGASGAGTVILESWRVSQGPFAGLDLTTTGTPIVMPANGWDCLGGQWGQNGQIEFDVVTPAIGSTGGYFAAFGDLPSSVSGQGNLCLFQYSMDPRAYFDRAFIGWSGTQRGRITHTYANLLWDGNKHHVKLVWMNYVLNGVRYMPVQLWIDYVLVGSGDMAASYGATLWSSLERVYASNGGTNATLGNLKPGAPQLPTGAIPVAA
ncbi:MAG: hypothetical protein M0Z94_05110 [Dehalococcoidales bacterium]|nr:hypothetical protein [Dehalococcoidales bacterium]